MSSMSTQRPIPPRILLAKIGLDGHDRGVKVLARSFRDAGIEVIYTGLWQTSRATMYAALQEDVGVVGVSLLSAAHMTVMPELVRLRRELDIEHIPIVLGGIVPDADYPALKDMGIAAIFNPGSPLDRILETVRNLAERHAPAPLNGVLSGYAAGDTRALARLLTALQRDGDLGDWTPPPGHATTVGITGSPGVGKSSFIGRLGGELRGRGHKVAVVAVDPTSPVTGGALLGDRLRMMHGEPDQHFFIRSMASGNVQGGLGPHCGDVVRVVSGFGFDYVLLETVGAGQADVAVRDIVDHTALLLMPQTGDAVQFSKAGIMEIADCFIINKCDLPGADATEGQLKSAVGDARPVFRATAIRDEGVAAVADWVTARD
ncbi:MAG: cobalamin-dependent protein [Phycisphaerae bacterium]